MWTWVVRGAVLCGAVLAVLVVVLVTSRPAPTLPATAALRASTGQEIGESASADLTVTARCGSVVSDPDRQVDVVDPDDAVLGDVASSGGPRTFAIDQFDLSGLDHGFAAAGCDRARSARTGHALELSLLVGASWLVASLAAGRRRAELGPA